MKEGVNIQDKEIVSLYWARDEDAIKETREKYSRYCAAVAYNILGSREDAEECLSDAFLRAWQSMPPHRPDNLAAYLGKLTRNIAFDRYRGAHTQKRGGGETALALDELAECLSGRDVEGEIDKIELTDAVNSFLSALPDEKRRIFALRYWYAMPVKRIARNMGKTRTGVSKILERLRGELKNYLTERGFEV